MDKRYVVYDACLHCSNGAKDSTLLTWGDRHISIEEKFMANQSDFSRYHVMNAEKFGVCSCSGKFNIDPDVWNSGELTNVQQLQVMGSEGNCTDLIELLQWQNVKEDVFIARNKAVLHDSWMVCLGGFGIVTLTNSGQAGENPAETLQENLNELEAIVDAYMAANGIDPSHKDELMESILLWNGYLPEDIAWDYESSELCRDFCKYMEDNYKYLFGYFEKGLYLDDGANGKIDLTYMMGIVKAMSDSYDRYNLMSPNMANDKGLLNAFLEACNSGAGKTPTEALNSFIRDYLSGNYDSQSKYTGFYNEITNETDALDMTMAHNNILQDEASKMSVRHKQDVVITNRIESGLDYNHYGYDDGIDNNEAPNGDPWGYKTDNRIAAEKIDKAIRAGSERSSGK